MLGWHFLDADRRLQFGKRESVEAGRTYTAEGPLVLCRNGMHASIRVLDALRYAPGPIVCRVRLGGEIIHDTDKSVARSRRVLWLADATTILHEFALSVATDALCLQEARGEFTDPRSWAALEVKARWLRGEATTRELDAAGDAAWAAAETAAKAAARDAAGDAAWAAAWAAAWDAAWAAAWAAARDAAWWDAAWAARAARAAWDARAAWAARAAWDARDAWDAWAARAAGAARDAWAARATWAAGAAGAALVVFTARGAGWIAGDPLLLTTGLRDAYAAGLDIALPTGPAELGWAMSEPGP